MLETQHIETDESHHTTHVVWSSAVERLTMDQMGGGSNPLTPPMQAFRFTGEIFTEPLRLRGYQHAALRSLQGQRGFFPSVAQVVERRIEVPSVAGSTPARGTGKLKR